MDDPIDLLKIKIEKAKRELPLETVNAIDAVDWRAAILGLRSKHGYTFEQLGDLETETELLLSGLITGEDYPRELESRMKISRAAVNELVNEMNDLVFRKIQEELIKNAERKKIFQKNSPLPESPISTPAGKPATPEVGNKDTVVLNTAGIEIIPEKLELETTEKPVERREDLLTKIEKPETVQPILAQKLSGSVKIGMVKTEHTLENITPTPKGVGAPTESVGTKTPKIDPYREIPE